MMRMSLVQCILNIFFTLKNMVEKNNHLSEEEDEQKI